MMVTIRGLPVKTKYQDVKVILKNECNITEFILDNLVNDESGMSRKVRVGLVEDSDGYEIIKCLNGLRMPGNYVLRVDIVGKPPPAGQQDQGRYEPKPASSFTNEYRNNYPNQHTNDFRGRPNAPGFESSYTAQESQFSGPTASHGPSGGHGSISSHGPMNSAGRPAPWSSSNSLNNQWNQTQSGSSQISYQQPGNPGYAQQYPSNSQRPNTGPYTHGRPEHGQRYGYSAKTNPHEMGGSRKPDNRTHVLRNVELVDTQPTNSPIQSGRYPPGQGFQQQPKPITIMKDNFQGPTTYDIGSSNPPSSYQRQRQGSPQPWATQGQQLKPQPYPKSNTGPYEKPYDQIRSSRPDLQKNAQPPMRTDVYKGFEKSGQRFSPHRPIASGGRPLSPSRPVGPVRAVSPSNTLAQGRRMSPSRRLMSPTRRLTSPADRMMSTLDRRPGGPPRDLSQRHQLSPHERPGRGNVPRFSPQRHHPNKPIDKNIDPALKSANHNRAAYDVTSQAPNQPVYSGGFRPNVHENVPFPRSTRQIEQNVPWQQDGEQMYAKMKKRDEDGLGTPRPNTYGDKHSPRKSRSPIRRDRSPIRDRYRRHSPSSPSPRRSWAFEKRRSPQVRDAPPPPNWPGQNIQDDGRFKPVSDIKEDNSKHGPVWDKHTFTKLDDSKRRNEKLEPYSGPSKVFRTDAHESHDELITKRQRDPIFGARNEFENRGDFRPTTNDEPKPYLNKQDIEYHYSAELENTRRLSEARRKESPRRGEAKSNEFKKFDKDIDIIYKRAQEFKKKADELRKSERRMKERSEERGRTTRIMEEKEFKVQSEASTRRIDDTFRRHDSPRRRMNESPRHRMDNSPRQRLDSSPRRRRDGSPRHRIDGSPRRRMEGSPRRRMEASPRRRMEGSPRRRMEGSPRRRMEDSPRRRMEDSPRRRMEGSPRRRMEGSPRRRMEGSPTRPMEDLPRRRMEDSPRRRMEGSPRRRMQGIDDSLQHRINDSPPRRIDDTPNYSRSDTENRRHGDLNTKVSPSREPVWKAVDKTRKLFAGLPLQVKIKRDKAAEEISKKIMSKKLVVAKLSSEARDRVLEELRKTISHKLTELFDVQDLAFIELVIKFQSRVSDQEKDKIFNDVVKSLPARIRNRKALGSDSPNVPHKKPKLSMDYKLIEESPNVPSRKRSPERKLMEKSSDVPSKKAKRSPENKTKEEATATQRTQGGIYKRIVRRPLNAMKTSRIPERKLLRTERELKKPNDLKKNDTGPTTIKKDVPSSDPVEKAQKEKNVEPKSTTTETVSVPVKLDALTTQIVESELQDIMIKVWQQLPDNPTDEAEALVVDKLRNNAGDSLRNILGLNVTKRLLNVFNSLYVKLNCSAVPKRDDVIKLMRKYNLRGLKRIQVKPLVFEAHVNTIEAFDIICSDKLIRCGPVKVSLIPVYKFDECPKNLITNFDDKNISDDDISDINKIINKSSINEKEIQEKVKESKDDIKVVVEEEAPKLKKTIEDKPEVEQKPMKPVNESVKKQSELSSEPKPQRPVKKKINKKTTEETKGEVKKAEPHKLKDNSAIKNVFIEGNDFDELDDDTILALMSEGIVVDECSGSE